MNGSKSFHSIESDKQRAVRQKVVETAHAKFMRHGIRRISMDEIARELRMSKKTLYRYFTDKESLVRGCTDLISERMIPVIMKAVSDEKPVAERLAAVLEVFSRLPSLVSTEFIRDIEADYPHLWREIDERRRMIFGLYGKMIEEGIKEKVINPDVHPRVVTRVLYAIIDRVFVPEVLGLGEFTTDDAVRTILAIFRAGIIVPKDDGKRVGSK